MLVITPEDYSYLGTLILALLIGFVLIIMFIWIKKVIQSVVDGFEMIYTMITKRPALVYFHPFLKKLDRNQERILKQQFTFYNRLDNKHKRYFRHRVASFINDKNFSGKEEFLITEEVKVLISATAVMLTFGFRDFIIKSIENILVYPTQYYSTLNNDYHKGEYNANQKTMVLSWDNFLHGFKIDDDKLNLGIHEFGHAIHFNSIYQEDINSIIFVDTFNELRDLLSSNEALKNRLVESEYLRYYAFTNDFELLAVVLETFIESPKEFGSKFPEVYSKVKQMLNFNFANY